MREAVGRLAIFDQFTPDLCDAIGIAEARSRGRPAWRGQSLFVETRQDGSLALRPLIRDYALHHLPLPASIARELRLAAAEWLARHRQRRRRGADAARRRRPRPARRPDGGRGRRPCWPPVTSPPSSRPAGPSRTALRTVAVEQVEGEARQIQGDWKGALACYERAAGGREALPAPLARRIGLLHYLRGHVDTALVGLPPRPRRPGAPTRRRWRRCSPGRRPRTGSAVTSTPAATWPPGRWPRRRPAATAGPWPPPTR